MQLDFQRIVVRCSANRGVFCPREDRLSAALEKKVQAQYERFLAELPRLRKDHEGEWVVYLDGPQVFLPDEDAAVDWAMIHLGVGTGCVIARVAEQRPVLLSAAVAFS